MEKEHFNEMRAFSYLILWRHAINGYKIQTGVDGISWPVSWGFFWLRTARSVEDVTVQPKIMTEIETVEKNKLYLRLVLIYLANPRGHVLRI